MAYAHTCRTFRLLLIGTSMALALSACGSSGSTRIASIGDVPPGATGDSGGGSGTGDGSGGNTGGGNTGGGSGGGTGDGTGGGSSGGGTGGNPGGGTGGPGTTGSGLAGPLLVTAGNTVIGLGDKHAGLANAVNSKLPAAGPVTGTVTAVLRKSGQTLVDLGNGQSAVLNRAGGAIGKLVTIDLGTGRVVGAPGATALIGVAALTPTQLAGVSVANPANGTTTGALGKVGTIVSTATGTVAGAVGGTLTSPNTGPVPSGSSSGGLIPAVTGTVNGVLGPLGSPNTGTVPTGAGLIPAATNTVTGVLGKAKTKLGK